MINQCIKIKDLPQGGQKTVYLAAHPSLGKVVVKGGLVSGNVSIERIRREVDLLASINSAYFPKQHFFQVNEAQGEFVIIEEYIEGETLRNVITTYANANEILEFLSHITTGLNQIWQRNVVHRDLKPENIIIRPNRIPCILDLGIARFIDKVSLTKSIFFHGPCTPLYASPEQLLNNKLLIDPRTDFFALGIIALELNLHSHPFDPANVGNHESIIDNILNGIYSILATNGNVAFPEIVDFAAKTLQTQPYKRFRNFRSINEFIAIHLKS